MAYRIQDGKILRKDNKGKDHLVAAVEWYAAALLLVDLANQTLEEETRQGRWRLYPRAYVIAGTHAEYREWLSDNGLLPQDFIAISFPEQARGLRGSYYLTVGTFRNNKAFDPVMLEAWGLERITLPKWLKKREEKLNESA